MTAIIYCHSIPISKHFCNYIVNVKTTRNLALQKFHKTNNFNLVTAAAVDKLSSREYFIETNIYSFLYKKQSANEMY